MKQLLLILLVFSGFALNGQLAISPGSIELDGSHRAEDIEINFTVENLADVPAEFLWTISNSSDIPAPWEAAVCDVNFCYTPAIHTCPEANVNELDPGAAHVFVFHVHPNEAEQAFTFNLDLFDVNDPSNIYASVEITLNTISSSTDDQDESIGLAIFPNPTTESFQIKNDSNVNTLAIYNIVGKQIKQFNHEPGKSYNVEDFRKGMYLVRLFDEGGKSLKALRLSKK